MHSRPTRTTRARPYRGLVTLFVTGALLALIAVMTLTATAGDDVRVAHGILPRTASQAAVLTDRRARTSRDVSTTTTSTTTTNTTATGTGPAPAPPAPDTTLPSPEDVPDPGVVLPIQVIGRIRIPKIGLDADLRDQITQESIDLGPSHWPGTAMPGAYGNAVIAGHRNSHSAPFHDAAKLRPGDAITLIGHDGRSFTYTITDMFVVDPSAVWITEQTPGRTLTLFTCHPLGSSAQRLVVRATLA